MCCQVHLRQAVSDKCSRCAFASMSAAQAPYVLRASHGHGFYEIVFISSLAVEDSRLAEGGGLSYATLACIAQQRLSKSALCAAQTPEGPDVVNS